MLKNHSSRFGQAFKYDSDGVPRHWLPDDSVAEYFQKAREEGKKVLELFIVLRLDEKMDDIEYLKDDNYDQLGDAKYRDLIILSRDEDTNILEKYNEDSNEAFRQAKREQDNLRTTTKIPYYMFIVTAILGWNEFLTVLYNPLASVFFLLLAGVGFVLYKLGMLGPTLVMIESQLRQVWEQILHQQQQKKPQQQSPSEISDSLNKSSDANKKEKHD
jgi:hypothetical protein